MIDPLKAIKRLIDKAGSQKAAAKELGISEPHLCDILNGRRSVSGELAKSLGFERVTVYWKVGQKEGVRAN
jgi:DNA-binding transcriptional regulator YdaS (Cro superfamily)